MFLRAGRSYRGTSPVINPSFLPSFLPVVQFRGLCQHLAEISAIYLSKRQTFSSPPLRTSVRYETLLSSRAHLHPVLTRTCLPNHCLYVDVIILGVSSSASLILVPAEAATTRRRRLDSMDVARCQVCRSALFSRASG